MTATQIGNWFRVNHKTANLPWGLTVDGLAQLFIEEGSAANVRGDVAFAQTIIETGWLSFPSYGQVHPGDYNYAGLGACNSCNGGHTFPDARDRRARPDGAAPRLRGPQLPFHAAQPALVIPRHRAELDRPQRTLGSARHDIRPGHPQHVSEHADGRGAAR